MSAVFKLLRLCVIVLISNIALLSADLTFLQTPEINYISYGLDKISGTYYFYNKANYVYSSDYGLFNVKQNYIGAANNSGGNSFRDDETFGLDYSYPLSSNFKILSESKITISSDSRSLGINDLQRTNSLLGIKYTPDSETFLAFKIGPENNKQSNVKANGFSAQLQGKTKEFDYDGYKLRSYAAGEYTSLNDDRKSKDVEFYIRTAKGFDDLNYLDLDSKIKYQNKDFLAQSTTISDINPLLNRIQSSFGASLNTSVSLTSFARTVFSLSFDKTDIERSYSTIIEGNDYSKSYRKQTDLNFSLNSEAELNLNKFRQNFGLGYYIRSSDNSITPKFSIKDAELNLLRNTEQLNNSNAGTTRFYSKTYWNFATYDTLTANYSVSLLQFDTPGKDNNDDRDELNIYMEASYGKKISDYLKASFRFEGKSSHIVYLKSQRSSANNKNKYIRFSPGFEYSSESFYARPVFEVLANYTVYDYEAISPGLASSSFRQISYRDSLSVTLMRDYFLSANVYYRYFEIGKLVWDNFSEQPQSNSFELFSKLSLNTNVKENATIGLGLRGNILKALNQKIIGPEATFKMKFSDNSFVTLTGWYEFRYINKIFQNSLLNLYISASTNL